MTDRRSLIALLGLIAAVGLLFFHIIQPFLLVVFGAVVLAVLFQPMHQWFTVELGERPRIAALLTTSLVLLLLVLPIGFTLVMAAQQIMDLGQEAVNWVEAQGSGDDLTEELRDTISDSAFGRRLEGWYDSLSRDSQERVTAAVSKLSGGMMTGMYEKTRGFFANLFRFLVALALITVGFYYFLADGEIFVDSIHRLFPLGRADERHLVNRFHTVCRGVVVGTIASGLVQAVLSGIGFAVLGTGNVWLLMVLVMFASFIPFLGSAAVWGSVAIYLALDQQYGSAIGLTVYGAGIVSTSDNLVRAYVIGHQAQLHPFVTLVTVLGALDLVGLWGIFVGPMVAAWLYALLDLFHKHLDHPESEALSNGREPASKPYRDA